jgi:uncharacterized integral membrane protein (TIGR00697 family)
MDILLIALYLACELTANVTASKPVAVGGTVVPAGVFIYALTFTLIDLINERLGKARARQVVYGAFAGNLLLAAYSAFAVWLPPAGFYAHQQAYAAVLGSTPRIVAASLLAYLVSALLDTEIFAWWRARVRGHRWARVLVSNAVSTFVDSVVFITGAFAGILPLLPLIWGQYLWKMVITVVSVPLIYLARGEWPAHLRPGELGP